MQPWCPPFPPTKEEQEQAHNRREALGNVCTMAARGVGDSGIIFRSESKCGYEGSGDLKIMLTCTRMCVLKGTKSTLLQLINIGLPMNCSIPCSIPTRIVYCNARATRTANGGPNWDNLGIRLLPI